MPRGTVSGGDDEVSGDMTEIDWSRGGASSGVEVVVLLHRSNNCILTRCEYEKILHFPGRFRLASPQIRMRASFWCGVRCCI